MRRAAIGAHGGAKARPPLRRPALAGLATSLFLRFELPDQRRELRGNGRHTAGRDVLKISWECSI
jgi:hypothetical protein